MATVASIEKKIKVKTFLTFLVCFFILLAISFFYAFFSYNQNIYHIQFFNKYLLNQTFYVFFNNFFYTSMIAVVFCFAVVIGRGDVISSDGKRLFFHQIAMPGLFFLIFLSLQQKSFYQKSTLNLLCYQIVLVEQIWLYKSAMTYLIKMIMKIV